MTKRSGFKYFKTLPEIIRLAVMLYVGFRAECLNSHWFMSLADAAEKMEAWRRDYKEDRPHGAIGNKVPAALMKPGHAASRCA